MYAVATLAAFHGKNVVVTRHDGTVSEGEFRTVWRDSVPYFPDIPTPAVWLTKWVEYFIPVADIASIETAA